MIRILISIGVFVVSLLSSVNPLVVFNSDVLKNQHKIVFLPDEQVMQAHSLGSNQYKLSSDETILILIKPYESLYIRPSDKRTRVVKAELSFDAKVFESRDLEIQSDKMYKLHNKHASLLAVKLRSQNEMKVSLLTTIKSSVLNQLNSTQVSLDCSAVNVYSKDKKSKELYYKLKKDQKLSFKVEGPGTLRLSMRAKLHENVLKAYRQRILVSVNKAESQVLESFSRLSSDHIHEVSDVPVSAAFSHYIILKEGENDISVKNFSELLLRAELFHDNTLNPMNSTSLNWKVPDDLSVINQPKWLNTNIDDGIKKMAFIEGQEEKIIDATQKKGLERSANISTKMKVVYPAKIPMDSPILNAYYAQNSLYLKDEIESISSLINEKNKYLYLNTLKRGSFYEVPEDGLKAHQEEYVVTLEKLYFKTRQYKLDRALKRELKNSLSTLKAYEEIRVDGFTDTRGNMKYNKNLSLQRCQSVKEELIALGVEAERIQISSHGESENAVNTKDEVKEISNRRVEINVVQNVSANKDLIYTFEQALQRDTKIALTFLSPNNEAVGLYMQVDGKKKLISYKTDTNTNSFSFSPGRQAFNLARENTEVDVISSLNVLKNSEGLSFVEQTGTIYLNLKKGTRELKFVRTKGSKAFKLSVSQQVNAPYNDTPYALAHEYNGSYLRFSNSLKETIPPQGHFDSWYQHTHSLRLFILSSIQEADKNLNKRTIPKSSDLEYAQKLLTDNERLSALEIAKHKLILSTDSKLQKRAYELLLELSTSTKQALMWHSVYFYKSSSSDSLKKISELLRDDGQYSLALTAHLLLDKDVNYVEEGSKLALILNNTTLSQNLLSSSASDIKDESRTKSKTDLMGSVIEEKAKLLSTQNYKYNRRIQSTSIDKSAGLIKIHSKNTKKVFQSHKATWQQGVELQVQGPVQLDFDIRVLSSIKRYEWLRIEHNKKTFHYPLTQVSSSISLETLPEHAKVGVNNHLNLNLGEGNHTLVMHGYDAPLAIKVNSKKIEKNSVKRLEEQLLLTSDFNASLWNEKRAEDSVVYASALLWNYTYSTYQHRYHSQAQSFLLQGKSSDPQVKSILRVLRQYSSFSLYPSLNTEAGFYDMKVPSWYPHSVLQKSRTPLLKGINKYNFILMGSDYKLIHMQGDQTFRVEVQQVYPDFLSNKALSFALSIDDKPEKILNLLPNQKKWSKQFVLSSGPHSLKIRLVKPLSTHYLGIDIFEDSKKLESDTSQRYFISKKDAPIVLYEQGPKLLRVEYRLEDGSLESEYLYFNESRQYHHEIYPLKSRDQSLVSVSELLFDPMQKSFEVLKSPVPLSVLLTDDDTHKESFQLDTQSPEKEVFESFDATCSLELSLKNEELSSDDDPDSIAKEVFEAGEYCRKRIRDELYVRQHYFTRLYENPMLALTHKAYAKLPFEDTWLRAEGNLYMQENDFVFKNLKLKSEVFVKEKLWPQWRHQYGVGLFRNFLDYDNSGDKSLDPLVYSRYKRDHQYGGTLLYDLYYRIFEDIEFAFESKAVSNEAFGIIDNIRLKPVIKHLAYPYYMSAFFDSRHYFEDRDRPEDYSINRLGIKLRYDDFFGMDRLQLQAGMIHKVESSDTQFSLQILWHFSDNKRYYNFMPDENLFNNLRLRLEDEK